MGIILDTNDLYKEQITASIKSIMEAIYPVGSLYIGTQTTNPIQTLGVGTWQLVGTNKALWCGDGTNANTTIDAGLPNITGNLTGLKSVSSNYTNGAVQWVTANKEGVYGSGNGSYGTFSINASRSSSIYGSSTTVQPPAYVVNVWRRIS